MTKYRFDQIATNSTAKKKPVEEDKYTYIGLEHLDPQNLIVTRWGSEVAPKGEKLLMKKGDVLFGKRRAYQKKVAIAPFDGIFSAHGMVLRPNEKVIDKRFFPMFISSDYFLETAIAISVGSLSPTINWKDLARIEFNLPPIEEQRRLANILWAINDTLQAYYEVIDKTNRMLRASFVDAFGDTLSREGKYNTVPLSSIFVKPQAGEWGEEDIEGNGIPVLRTTNFTDEGYITYDDVVTRIIDNKKFEKKSLVQGDILIEKSGGSNDKPVGRVVLFEGENNKYVNNNFTACLHLNGKHDVSYLYVFYFMFVNYWLGGTKLFEGKTTGIHNLKLMDYLNGTYIPLPPIEEQHAFENIALLCKKSIISTKSAIESAKEIKTSLLKEALEK